MKETTNNRGSFFRQAIIVGGGALWLFSTLNFIISHVWHEQLLLVALCAATVVVGMFTTTFRLPSGLKFTEESMTFTLSDALVLLIAFNYGIAAATFVAGIESFVAARRGQKRQLTVALFNAAMMAFAAAAAASSIHLIKQSNFALLENQSFLLAAAAMLVGSVVQTLVNLGMLSVLLSLRHGNSFLHYMKGFLTVAPTLLLTGTTASLLNLALSYNLLVLLVVGAPVLAALLIANRQQRNSVQNRVSILEKAHRETIEALAVTINAKDEVTHDHVLRVQIYAAGVARILGCSEHEVEALKAGALLHDIGKIAVPDFILNKPGKLTAQEFEKMKMHTVIGAQILGRVEFPYPVVPIVRSHHERWDGKGYPDGLAAENIPLTARILSVVDCFDAVREDRQYRRAMTREQAIGLLMEGSGTQYDPRVVGAFVTHLPEFEAEINANRHTPVPNFGIEPLEELSATAREVAPAAGLAEVVEQSLAPTRTNVELEALYTLARRLPTTNERLEMAKCFTENLRKLLPFDLCTVTLTDLRTGDNRCLHFATGDNAELPAEVAALLERRTAGLGEGVTGWVIANRRYFSNVDPKLDLPVDAPAPIAEHFSNFKTIAATPISHNRTIFGAITIYSSKLTAYTPAHEQMLNEATSMLATALHTQQVATVSTIETNDAAIIEANEVFESHSATPMESALTH